MLIDWILDQRKEKYVNQGKKEGFREGAEKTIDRLFKLSPKEFEKAKQDYKDAAENGGGTTAQ